MCYCFNTVYLECSSFGSDLKTTTDMKETIMSILVSISGMALFLVYLNARVQVGVFKLKAPPIHALFFLKPSVVMYLAN